MSFKVFRGLVEVLAYVYDFYYFEANNIVVNK